MRAAMEDGDGSFRDEPSLPLLRARPAAELRQVERYVLQGQNFFPTLNA
jgi:hypothetical protein